MPVDHTCEIVMEMHQVRYFLALAEELNFTRASERCNVTQPSLSRAIKLLEEELGGLLFHRERESTCLTDLGHMVLPHLQSVYDQSGWRSAYLRVREKVAAQTGDHEHDLARRDHRSHRQYSDPPS